MMRAFQCPLSTILLRFAGLHCVYGSEMHGGHRSPLQGWSWGRRGRFCVSDRHILIPRIAVRGGAKTGQIFGPENGLVFGAKCFAFCIAFLIRYYVICESWTVFRARNPTRFSGQKTDPLFSAAVPLLGAKTRPRV